MLSGIYEFLFATQSYAYVDFMTVQTGMNTPATLAIPNDILGS